MKVPHVGRVLPQSFNFVVYSVQAQDPAGPQPGPLVHFRGLSGSQGPGRKVLSGSQGPFQPAQIQNSKSFWGFGT